MKWHVCTSPEKARAAQPVLTQPKPHRGQTPTRMRFSPSFLTLPRPATDGRDRPILRDKHAVPNVRLVLGKRIGVLAENDMAGTYPEDMMNLMRQAVAIINHLGSGNHKDIHNKRALEITEAKIAGSPRITSG